MPCDITLFLELDKATNTCIQMTPSADTCTLIDSFFNLEATTCDIWTICSSVNEDLDTTTNQCLKMARIEAFCTDLELAYDSANFECIEDSVDVTVCGQN